MIKLLSTLFIVMIAITAFSRSVSAEYIWIEGENPTTANVDFKSGGWGNSHYLSDGKWLFGNIDASKVESTIPPEGAILTYEFDTKQDIPQGYASTKFEVWIRIGYEFARSPFLWRIDDNDWQEISPDELTIDLMVIAEWCEVAWLKLGVMPLDSGKHTFEFKLVKRAANSLKRVLFGLDCICISREQFRPNGRYKPDDDWQNELDHRAADQVFEFQTPDHRSKDAVLVGERSIAQLSGVWQIARFDEQELNNRTEPIKKLPDNADEFYWKGIKVPGNRDTECPELLYCHRFLYRTKVRIPKSLDGRSFFLRFPSTCLIASVIVNGQYCGFSKAPCANWDCDVTAAVEPGKINEICVGIKDVYYAISKTGEGKSARYLFNMHIDQFYH